MIKSDKYILSIILGKLLKFIKPFNLTVKTLLKTI